MLVEVNVNISCYTHKGLLVSLAICCETDRVTGMESRLSITDLFVICLSTKGSSFLKSTEGDTLTTDK